MFFVSQITDTKQDLDKEITSILKENEPNSKTLERE